VGGLRQETTILDLYQRERVPALRSALLVVALAYVLSLVIKHASPPAAVPDHATHPIPVVNGVLSDSDHPSPQPESLALNTTLPAVDDEGPTGDEPPVVEAGDDAEAGATAEEGEGGKEEAGGTEDSGEQVEAVEASLPPATPLEVSSAEPDAMTEAVELTAEAQG
jgi:hypothetical protein